MVWKSLGAGDVFTTREGGQPFIFATGQEATLKADAERLNDHPHIIAELLQLYADHPCIASADILSFVPNGTAAFTDKLGHLMDKRVIRLFRPRGAARTDIQFRDGEAKGLTREAQTICLIEDISRTGFSAHATAKVLRSVNPKLTIHTISLLQRDAVEQQYQEGPDAVVYHTFVRRDLPLTLEEFKQQFPSIPVHMVA